jgi:hypothetical protein
MASTAMIVTAYYFLNREKKFAAVLCYLLAIGLHTTAILYVPFILLSKIEFKPETMVRVLLIAVVFSFLFSSLIDASFLSSVLGRVKIFGVDEYVGYFEKERYMNGMNIKGLIKLLVFPALLCVISIRTCNNRASRIYFWGIVLVCVLAPVTAIAVRACMGLTAAEILVLPNAWAHANKRQKRILVAYLIIFSLYFAYTLVTVYSNPEELGPYHFVA